MNLPKIWEKVLSAEELFIEKEPFAGKCLIFRGMQGIIESIAADPSALEMEEKDVIR